MKTDEVFPKILEQIFTVCCNILRISDESAKLKCRKSELVMARMFYYKYAKQYTSYSLSLIGKLVKKDHATVLYGIKTINNDIQHNSNLNQTDKRIESMVLELVERDNIVSIDLMLKKIDELSINITFIRDNYLSLSDELKQIANKNTNN